MTAVSRWLILAIGTALLSLVVILERATAAPAMPRPGVPSPHGAPAASPHGGTDAPVPGRPFALRGRPAGTLVVGTLTKAGPVEGVEVTLTIAPPKPGEEAPEPIVRRATSDSQGRAVFDNLLPPDVPEGSKLVVEAKVTPEGETQRAGPFELGKTGVAVVLSEGFDADPHASQGRRRARLPRPRPDPSLAPGTVRVRLVNGEGEPVSGQVVQVVERDVTGRDTVHEGRTGADGVTVVDDVEAHPDALYGVEVTYDGGPYRSRLFELPTRAGMAVDLAVFETTSDITTIKGAVRLELRARENDLLQVVQVHELVVEGEKAYWPTEGLEVIGVDGSRDFAVMGRAGNWLEHRQGASSAKLAVPIPPGELVQLSVAYLLEHDGTARLTWTPPVPLLEVTIVTPGGLVLEAAGAEQQPAGDAGGGMAVYRLGPLAAGSPLEVTASGFPVRSPILRRIGAGTSLAMVLGVVIAIALGRRRTAREQLLEHRDELLRMLDENERQGGQESGRTRIIEVLDRVYRQLDAMDPPPSQAKGGGE
jgi:hypothetical protein